jgi:anti-sigma factor RsiW
MQENLQHPSEETLERFVLHQMQEEELEGMESHIMACDNCVSRLEFLEIQIAATKLALADLHQEKVAESFAKQKKSSWGWLKVSGYSLAGVAAAAVLTVSNMPNTVERDISAFRGSETIQLPVNHPLFLHMNAKDLTAAPVAVEVVSAEGNEIWKGDSVVKNQTVDAHLPKITEKGNYLLRLYASNKDQAQGNLLREFAVQVQ